MTSNSTSSSLCAQNDTICMIREHQLEVIIVPTLLLSATFITLLIIFSSLCCHNQERRRAAHRYHTSKHRHTNTHHHTQANRNTHPLHHEQPHHHTHHHHEQPRHHTHHHHEQPRHHTHHHHEQPRHHTHHQTQPRHHTHHHHEQPQHRSKKHNRHHLRGIDAPPGINPLEHEEVPMTVQNRRPNAAEAAVPQTSTEGPLGGLSQVTALPTSFSIKPNDTVSLHRAQMNNRDVILRVLKETANSRERQHFLGFASFLSGLGPHPFIPALLGVVSVQPPLTLVVEELKHRDLLGFLWECRQDNSSQDMTEKRVFIMAGQVASALEYLHSRSCVHGNVAARSILVGGDLTAKLWGLGSAYRRTQSSSGAAVEDMELRKWQAPEVLAGRSVSQSSDVWSFGTLIYEMVTLGDPPFAQIMATELLQYLQRGKTLKRPPTCSSSLYSVIKSCCHWTPQHRVSLTELIRTLQAGESSANGRTVLRVPEPHNLERYKREAGIGEAYNFAVF